MQTTIASRFGGFTFDRQQMYTVKLKVFEIFLKFETPFDKIRVIYLPYLPCLMKQVLLSYVLTKKLIFLCLGIGHLLWILEQNI